MTLHLLAPLAQVDNTNLEQLGALDSVLDMSTTALFALACSMVVPFVMAVVNRSAWSSTVKFSAVCACCVLVSAGWLVVRDEFEVGDWVRMTLVVIVGATVAYKLFVRPVKEVEAATG